MPQSYINLNYHIVFSTKNRAPIITAGHQPRLFEYIGGIIRGNGGVAMAIGGMPDHVHLHARLRQDKAISDLIREMKAGSSGWMHDIFPEAKDFGWQNGYAAFSVSQALVANVKSYIEHQAEHHSRDSFEDEFVELLNEHGIEFDPGYLFR